MNILNSYTIGFFKKISSITLRICARGLHPICARHVCATGLLSHLHTHSIPQSAPESLEKLQKNVGGWCAGGGEEVPLHKQKYLHEQYKFAGYNPMFACFHLPTSAPLPFPKQSLNRNQIIAAAATTRETWVEIPTQPWDS